MSYNLYCTGFNIDDISYNVNIYKNYYPHCTGRYTDADSHNIYIYEVCPESFIIIGRVASFIVIPI